MMSRWITIAALAALHCRAFAGGPSSSADFATKVLAYSGVNGVSGYTSHPEYAIGPPSTSASPIVPDNSSVFSFGWGGFITLGFDKPITNDPRHPGGYDFIVFGNAFYAGGDPAAPYREPGYVEVGVDPTGLHQYNVGVKWYWLKGSPAPASVSGFPIAPPGWTDTVIGYADCTPTDGSGDPLVPSDPYAASITPGSAGGDAFNLDWAVDANNLLAHLDYADFVRVTCAVNALTNLGNPYSTEVDAVSLVRPRVPGDVDYDNTVTISDACLALRAALSVDSLDIEQQRRADVTGHDGPPTVADAAAILQTAAGMR
ncbi:MAG TPA: dockerin type I repeat-containing protein [Armatimonadota bacterium]|jgi:hypothetical protein